MLSQEAIIYHSQTYDLIFSLFLQSFLPQGGSTEKVAQSHDHRLMSSERWMKCSQKRLECWEYHGLQDRAGSIMWELLLSFWLQNILKLALSHFNIHYHLTRMRRYLSTNICQETPRFNVKQIKEETCHS